LKSSFSCDNLFLGKSGDVYNKKIRVASNYGTIKPKFFFRMRLVQAWIVLHKDELVANWELSVLGDQPYKIDPLR
jgi:hypothetical protein